MSQAERQQELFAEPNAPVARPSGRYAVGDEPATALRAAPESHAASASHAAPAPHVASESHAAPASHVATEGALRLLEINMLSAEELAWIDVRKNRSNSEPVRGRTSAVFAKHGEDPTFGALQPFYREPTLERIQLQFEDLSLDPSHNPLARSSLLPPPRRALGMSGMLAIGVAALALSGVGYLVVVASWGGSSASTTVMPPARKAKAPHVVKLEVPPQAPILSTLSADALPGAGGAGDVLWSSPAPSAVAGSPPAVAASATTGPLSPGWRQRRLVAWRARMAAVRAVSAAPELAPVALPAQPSREQIRAGLESVRPALQSCVASLHGTTTARVSIASTGRVASATIEGSFAGTPEGSCMARALRNAVFPRFSLPSLQVTYPFRL